MTDAALAAMAFAVDPAGCGGIAVRSGPGSARDAWLTEMRRALGPTQIRRMPPTISEERLLGGLDLPATLSAGRPIAARGILAETDGGVLLLVMAERLPAGTVSAVCATLDTGAVWECLGAHSPASLGVIAFDEGEEDERLAAPLLDRLAFHVIPTHDPDEDDEDRAPQIADARRRLPDVTCAESLADALVTTAAILGIASLRAPVLALRVARILAALDGRDTVTDEDAAAAARLVLAPRATVLPQSPPDETDQTERDPRPEQEPTEQAPNPDPQPEQQPDTDRPDSLNMEDLQEMLLEAARAAIPPGLLDSLHAATPAGRTRAQGKAGAQSSAGQRGRPVGERRADLRDGARINLVATLRAAAPWQRLRQRADTARIQIHADDIRVSRFRQRTRTVAIFVVDASGSAALNRLAEAKGAVEIFLSECYVRRDQVAVLAFRGKEARLLLPPTHSLTRARRSLGKLAGGGTTPLASAIHAAIELAEQVRRKGQTPSMILLSDGRGNIARDGTADRPRAEADLQDAARRLRATRLGAILVDISPRPAERARALAAEMGARYVPLPYADANSLARVAEDLPKELSK